VNKADYTVTYAGVSFSEQPENVFNDDSSSEIFGNKEESGFENGNNNTENQDADQDEIVADVEAVSVDKYLPLLLLLALYFIIRFCKKNTEMP